MSTVDENISLSLLVSQINGMSNRWAQEHAINPYKLKPLYALYLEPSITQKKISETCSLPKQTVSNAIRELKAKGYVMLENDADDKREKHIVLTESGKNYLAEITAPAAEMESRVIARMGMDTYISLLDGLKKYAQALAQEVGR